MALTLRKALADQLGALLTFSTDDLLARRSTRLSLYGKYLEEKSVISTQVVTNKTPEAPKEEAKPLKEEPVAPKEEKKVKPRKAAAKNAAPKKKASKATQVSAEKSTGKKRTGTRKAKKAEAS